MWYPDETFHPVLVKTAQMWFQSHIQAQYRIYRLCKNPKAVLQSERSLPPLRGKYTNSVPDILEEDYIPLETRSQANIPVTPSEPEGSKGKGKRNSEGLITAKNWTPIDTQRNRKPPNSASIQGKPTLTTCKGKITVINPVVTSKGKLPKAAYNNFVQGSQSQRTEEDCPEPEDLEEDTWGTVVDGKKLREIIPTLPFTFQFNSNLKPENWKDMDKALHLHQLLKDLFQWSMANKKFNLASHWAELGASFQKICLKEIDFRDLRVITKGWNPTRQKTADPDREYSDVHLRELVFQRNQPEDRGGFSRTRIPGRHTLDTVVDGKKLREIIPTLPFTFQFNRNLKTKDWKDRDQVLQLHQLLKDLFQWRMGKIRLNLASHWAERAASFQKIFLKEIDFKDLMVITKGWNPTRLFRPPEVRENRIRENQAKIQALEEELTQTGYTQIPSGSQGAGPISSPLASYHSETNRSVAKSHHSSQSQEVSRRRQGYKGKTKTAFNQRKQDSDPMIQKLLDLVKEAHKRQK
ncbi:hypothetical protein O181_029277 [Austropuccinia psidii MF-1]|uniref:Uncharacterized protein n=1 Tax=Austropuccinia psidii MF-1 TaxID=1389203 RepID=A0A9Q3CTH9_9BASI|nr:hypothetical protein [Austropuccinia psidii MF-1]